MIKVYEWTLHGSFVSSFQFSRFILFVLFLLLAALPHFGSFRSFLYPQESGFLCFHFSFRAENFLSVLCVVLGRKLISTKAWNVLFVAHGFYSFMLVRYFLSANAQKVVSPRFSSFFRYHQGRKLFPPGHDSTRAVTKYRYGTKCIVSFLKVTFRSFDSIFF